MEGEINGGAAADHPAARRRRWRRVVLTGLLGVVSIGVLSWLAPPDAVIHQLGEVSPEWVVAAIALELGSCLSYVVIFRRFFPEPPREVSRRVAWIAMGAGAILPGGNISSAAATGWLLRRHGIGTRQLLERCAALLCLLTGFGFALNGIAGILLALGVAGGPHDLTHTGGPILVSAVVLFLAAALMLLARHQGSDGSRPVRAIGVALEGAWHSALTPNWRLLGGAGFLCLDMAALWAATAATGHPLGLLALLIAYCIGYLATMIPMPAGLGVLDSGLAGALVLYHLPAAAALGAVLIYHAISLWVPGLGALTAWMPIRRRPRLPERPPVAIDVLGLRLTDAAEPEGQVSG